MTARRLYTVIYSLMVQEAGSRSALEEWLEERAQEFDLLEARRNPKADVPESLAKDMREAMAMMGPAPRRDSSDA